MRHLIPLLAILAAGCPKSLAARESRASLHGTATFYDVPITEPQRGTVRLIVRGTGDISDDCRDAASRSFVAVYDGELAIAADGTFTADLVPRSPPVTTPSGCPVTNVDVQQVDSVTIGAELPQLGLEGKGKLTWQTMTALDNTDLQHGDFSDLEATLGFTRANVARR